MSKRVPMTINDQKVGTAEVREERDTNGSLHFVVAEMRWDEGYEGLSEALEMPDDIGQLSINQNPKNKAVVDWPPKGGRGIQIEVEMLTCRACGGQDHHHQPHCPHHPRNWR